MQYVGSSSWLIRIDTPVGLLMGLYLRDAAGLQPVVAVEVPAVVPAVAIRADLAPLAVPAASVQWARWWDQELARQDGPGRGFFRPDRGFKGAELGALVDACHDDAARWSADRHHEASPLRTPGSENGLVAAVEAEIGRRARPFELTITVLPVAGSAGWRVSAGHVVVSRAFRTDQAAYRPWLTQVLRELA